MDYVKQIDKLIAEFAGETSGLLTRVDEVSAEIEFIESHISSLKKALTSYEKSISESEKKIHAASTVFEELKATLSNLSSEIALIKKDQHGQAQSLKSLDLINGISKNIMGIFHAVTDLTNKIEGTSAAIQFNGKTVEDKYRITNSKLEEIEKAHIAIAGQLTILKSSHDAIIAHIQESSQNLESLKTVYSQLSMRLDSIAVEVESSKNNAEDNNKRVQDTLDKILEKMENIEGILTTKKKGLFK